MPHMQMTKGHVKKFIAAVAADLSWGDSPGNLSLGVKPAKPGGDDAGTDR